MFYHKIFAKLGHMEMFVIQTIAMHLWLIVYIKSIRFK